MKSLLFSDPMMRALLEGRKTMTRRLVAGFARPVNESPDGWTVTTDGKGAFRFEKHTPQCSDYIDEWSPLRPGDVFYAREAWQGSGERGFSFRADLREAQTADLAGVGFRWRSPRHLRAADARWFGRVTEVRAERLQDISEEDCDAECFGGDWPHKALPGLNLHPGMSIRECFAALWASIHGHGTGRIPEKKRARLERQGRLAKIERKMAQWAAACWDSNPWVWVYRFEPLSKSAALAATNTNT